MKILYHDDHLYVGEWPWESGGQAPLAGDALRVALAETVRRLAYDRLAPTDWYVTRQAETGEPVPPAVAAARAAVRAWAAERETVIAQAAGDEALLAVDLERNAS